MIKRLNAVNTFEVKDKIDRKWIIVLEHLKNTNMGCPRFKATLIMQDGMVSNVAKYNVVYQFTGHYLNDYDEAKWILNYHLENI